MCTASSCTRLAIAPGKRWIAGRSRKIGVQVGAGDRAASSVPSRSRSTYGPMNAFCTGTC